MKGTDVSVQEGKRALAEQMSRLNSLLTRGIKMGALRGVPGCVTVMTMTYAFGVAHRLFDDERVLRALREDMGRAQDDKKRDLGYITDPLDALLDSPAAAVYRRNGRTLPSETMASLVNETRATADRIEAAQNDRPHPLDALGRPIVRVWDGAAGRWRWAHVEKVTAKRVKLCIPFIANVQEASELSVTRASSYPTVGGAPMRPEWEDVEFALRSLRHKLP